MVLRLDGRGPLWRQLYRAMRDAIVAGRLAPGSRAPATRALSAELGLSRTTVLLAYDQLLAEGYLTGRRGSGTFVGEAPAAAPRAPREVGSPAVPLSRVAERLLAERRRPLLSAYASERPGLPYDFRYGLATLQDFPVETWQRCLGRRARRAPLRAYDYGPPQGSPALRTALAGYLGRARGVACDPEQIVIVSGSQQGLDLAARVLLDPGAAAAVEEPGYEGARGAFRAVGAKLVPIPVDAEGLDPAALARRRVRVVHVTPSHQYPLGGVMSWPRRAALLAWAERAGTWIIEDDYDGEFRLDGRPLQALKGVDAGGRVVYLGTFSKVLFPALRLGYVVLPPPLVEPFVRAKLVADGGSARLEQDALADFLASGAFERHVRRARARHRERRAALLTALATHFGDRVEVVGAAAGLHVVAWLRDLAPSRSGTFARRAAAAGVGVYSITPHYLTPPARAGFILGYGGLTPAAIRDGVKRLAAVLDEVA
jgi:GntR family transcriptional regulator/MocR family aminotransferase